MKSKKNILISIAACSFIFACTNSSQSKDVKDRTVVLHDSLLKAIAANEEAINKAMGTAELDMQLAAKTVNTYQQFIKEFPTDTSVALYLYKSSAIYAGAMKQYDAGAACLEKIIQEHKDFKKLPMCYFQLGAIFDDNLNDDVKAKMYYEEFLKKFPDHKLAPQVQSLISLLGKTNEEVIKEFEKKNRK